LWFLPRRFCGSVGIVVRRDVAIVHMGLKKRVTISWSGGKDSAFALYKILLSGEYEVVSLHTLINTDTRRVGLHGVHEKVMDLQAAAIGIPLEKLYIATSADHNAFDAVSRQFYSRCVRDHIDAVVFGDIFLEDLRQYREDLLADSGLAAIFPLWQIDTRVLIDDFINTGFRTWLCAADVRYFAEADMGRELDADFIAALPAAVDPCGERGEFHTLVVEGPCFRKKLSLMRGEVVRQGYDFQKKNDDGTVVPARAEFWFQEFIPA
jgi:uncharacterized protein (TIGR00290 family)